MSHPVYGVGASALVYIGDEVSDRADGVPIGTVLGIQLHIDGRHVAVRDQLGKVYWYPPEQLCLVKRAEP